MVQWQCLGENLGKGLKGPKSHTSQPATKPAHVLENRVISELYLWALVCACTHNKSKGNFA